MTTAMHLPVLLLEPSALLRQTVALTAISIGVGSVWQASNIRAAMDMVKTQPFSGAVVALDATDDRHHDALPLIESIRSGMTASPAGIPVYVVVNECSQSLMARLGPLDVERVLIKPFRARVLIEALASLFAESAKAVHPSAYEHSTM
jgi:DNA-binding NarL/FixJ family response regulator